MHAMQPSNAGFVGGAIFIIIWFMMMAGVIVGWLIFLIAIWKGMRAHESIAQSLKQIAQK